MNLGGESIDGVLRSIKNLCRLVRMGSKIVGCAEASIYECIQFILFVNLCIFALFKTYHTKLQPLFQLMNVSHS
ncbi:trihelix transcription factor GT-3b-like [Iris pallida]|uniref:Trihelix transcription factor GT-3b-like n=1 Tax=Iris pallida TaxID=29817 RepID=A0AAX6F6Z2_IRIPA|nr:trihelix transcription factor GT-3b-like [Iris pallida]